MDTQSSKRTYSCEFCSLIFVKKSNLLKQFHGHQQPHLNCCIQRNRMRTNVQKSKKILRTSHKKCNYTVHYRTLQKYVQLGLKIIKVHRVLQFRQSKWLQPYVIYNGELQKQSSTDSNRTSISYWTTALMEEPVNLSATKIVCSSCVPGKKSWKK